MGKCKSKVAPGLMCYQTLTQLKIIINKLFQSMTDAKILATIMFKSCLVTSI